MSLLQINTAVPLIAQPLLEQHKGSRTERRTDNTQDFSKSQFRPKFIILGALTGFFIQIVSVGAYAFLLAHYQFQQLKQQQQNESSSSSVTMPYGTDTAILYTILFALTQLDLVVYVLIWTAFTCTMTRNGMSCIRSQFFNIVSSSNSSQEGNSSSNNDNKTKSIKKTICICIRCKFFSWYCIR
jgi:hypothetical protein